MTNVEDSLRFSSPTGGRALARVLPSKPMKAYVMITGTIFGLIALAHGFRVYAEGPQRLKDPVFMILTALAAALCCWAWRLVLVCSRRS